MNAAIPILIIRMTFVAALLPMLSLCALSRAEINAVGDGEYTTLRNVFRLLNQDRSRTTHGASRANTRHDFVPR
ncbi:hypothetical protein EV421DRAFT_1338666 [Armillaria borealis]|uniref:Uncharacterized protein n=1 Tax=Armillaria borealis TaxID=47425 RepID=A0AA39MIA3_9AGAR|nr:hypothetical protein EV421DRAFT_1338666 [Armillaria borealis]